MAREISRSELEEMLLTKGVDLIDVRESDDGADGIPGHRAVPLSRINDLSGKISANRPTVFYCRSGVMSFQAAEIAERWTSQPVYYLSGGLLSTSSGKAEPQ